MKGWIVGLLDKEVDQVAREVTKEINKL